MLTILLVALALYIFGCCFAMVLHLLSECQTKSVTGLDPRRIKKNGRAIAPKSFSRSVLKPPFMPSPILPTLWLQQTPFLGRSSTKGTIPSSSAALAAILSSILMMPWSYLGLSHWHVSSLIGKWRYIALVS